MSRSSKPPTPQPTPPALEHRHAFEMRIRQDLMARPEFRFSSLVVHRIPDGICLEGVVETSTASEDLSQMAKQVAGVNEVINHLITCPSPSKPKKNC